MGSILLIFSVTSNALGAITPEQEIRSHEIQEREQKLRERIETPRKVPEVKEEKPAQPVLPESKEKVLIKKIDVTGATIISKSEIDNIILPFENKECTLKDMQKIADLITDAYRQKGYVTSRAYLPPQKIEEGVLQIKVIEGLTGTIEIKGNRYFKSSLFRKKITLKEGEFFNYNILRDGVRKINEQPDRNVRAVLMPGKEPQTTDVVLEVEDRLPIHIGFDWDDLGSRYIRKQRYTTRFQDNNLLGFEDKFSFEYQLAQASSYILKNIGYLFPISDWEIGMFAVLNRVKLGKELENSDVTSKSEIYSLFANRSLVNTDNVDVKMHLGFDYKNTTNYQQSALTSADRLRVLRTGFDTDVTDNFGRTILTYELNYGIPGIMGGLEEDSSTSSRSGAGGKFVKNTFNLLRLQKLPFSSVLLWKNQVQLSPYILTSSEEFQIGGDANVRGYPAAEAVGDSGYAMTWEWLCPLYFLSKNIKVPYSKAKLYDAVRFALFYDWANAHLRRPLSTATSTEEKNKTLRSFGCGLRFNLPEDLSFKVDFAWPLDSLPSDGHHLHILAQFSKTF